MNSIIWGIQRCMIWITIITLGRGLHWRFPPNISTNFLKCERFREYNFSHIFDFDFWSACWCISWEIYIHIVSQLEVSARGRTFYYNSSHGVQLCLGLSDSTQTSPGCPEIVRPSDNWVALQVTPTISYSQSLERGFMLNYSLGPQITCFLISKGDSRPESFYF